MASGTLQRANCDEKHIRSTGGRAGYNYFKTSII